MSSHKCFRSSRQINAELEKPDGGAGKKNFFLRFLGVKKRRALVS
jgi:hypothetical protein